MSIYLILKRGCWEKRSAAIDTKCLRKETQPFPQSLLSSFSIFKRWVLGYKHRIIVNEHLVLLGYDTVWYGKQTASVVE